ncbi:MAG: glycoside hydrolase [Clostridiales bacterium]|nr:glycoside hydrolase [Clostridiales bacterium]
MKKYTFGTPEAVKPSNYCKKFQYVESEIKYDVSKIVFKKTARGCVLEFPMTADENIFGLGLQLNQMNFTGRHAKLKVNSDPVAATGDSHAPVPFFVSTAGYGIYFDTARYVEFDFGKKRKGGIKEFSEKNPTVKLSTEELYTASNTEDSYITVCIPVSQGIDIYVFEGETITDIVSQYNMLSGGGCKVPDWGLGLWYRCCGTYTQEQVLATAKYFQDKEIPCSVIGIEPGWQTRAYSCTFEWNKEHFPKPKEMLEVLYKEGYHVNLWEHAYTHPASKLYNSIEEYSGNYLVWSGLVPDFTLEEARVLFAKHHNDNVDFGLVDGYKLDECDSSDFKEGWCFPDCSEFPSGLDGEQYHCLFGTLYMQTMLKSLNGKETYSEVRSAGALCASYPFVLYSDLYDHGDFIRGMVTSGFSGLLWTPEVRHADTREEFLRRLQSVVFSVQCLINGWYCEELPWISFGCEEELRHWIQEREKLKPLLFDAFVKYEKTGIPPIRALVSDYTKDQETYFIDDEYIFCDNLIVAPIKAGEKGRKVYLPNGKWKNYFTGEEQKCGWFDVETDSIPVYQKIGGEHKRII